MILPNTITPHSRGGKGGNNSLYCLLHTVWIKAFLNIDLFGFFVWGYNIGFYSGSPIVCGRLLYRDCTQCVQKSSFHPFRGGFPHDKQEMISFTSRLSSDIVHNRKNLDSWHAILTMFKINHVYCLISIDIYAYQSRKVISRKRFLFNFLYFTFFQRISQS